MALRISEASSRSLLAISVCFDARYRA